MDGIWVSPDRFVSFAEVKPAELTREIASRSTAWDFSQVVGLLPDPDPVLRKRGDGVQILEELLGDAHLTSVVQTRKLGTLKREYKWEPGTVDGEDTPASEALCAQFVADLTRVDLYSLISGILDAPLYGMAPVELLWEPGDGHLRLADLRCLPARWFGFDQDNALRFRSLDQPTEGEVVPFGKMVVARHFPTYDNPYGLRLLSRCFWPVMFKKGSIKFWVTFTEKYGMPFLLGRYARGSSLEDQQTMLASLVKMVRDAVAVVPEGSTVEMLGGTGKTGGSYLAFERLKDTMDAEISKAIMGQTLTAEIGDKGSYAASQTHENVLALYQDADQKLVKTALEEIAWIYGQANAPDVPPPTFAWFEDEDPQKEFAERDKALTEGGRVRLKKEYYIRRYGFNEDEIEVVEQAGPGQPGGEFSEAGAARFTAEQQALENLADKAVAEASSLLAGNEEKLLAAITGAGGFEEAMERVLALYPEMDMDKLAALLEQVMLSGQAYGTYTAAEEGGA